MQLSRVSAENTWRLSANPGISESARCIDCFQPLWVLPRYWCNTWRTACMAASAFGYYCEPCGVARQEREHAAALKQIPAPDSTESILKNGIDYPNAAIDTAWSTLALLYLTPRIRDYLTANDPQALDALRKAVVALAQQYPPTPKSSAVPEPAKASPLDEMGDIAAALELAAAVGPTQGWAIWNQNSSLQVQRIDCPEPEGTTPPVLPHDDAAIELARIAGVVCDDQGYVVGRLTAFEITLKDRETAEYQVLWIRAVDRAALDAFLRHQPWAGEIDESLYPIQPLSAYPLIGIDLVIQNGAAIWINAVLG